jgi:hypothetical protein
MPMRYELEASLAKGNDGNLLQHGVECAVAAHLVAEGRPLHLVSTHAMAPYELFEHPRHGAQRIDQALQMAQEPQGHNETPLIPAYRATEADENHYPNSAELIAAVAARGEGLLVGRSRLTGTLVEWDPAKFLLLQQQWHEGGVELIHDSWRVALRHGRLACSGSIDRPWLFSMDPMTFVSAGDKDDDRLHEADICRLLATFEGYLRSGQRGAILIFCYSLRKNLAPWSLQLFECSMIHLVRRLGVGHLCFVECNLPNPHVGAVLATNREYLDTAKEAWALLQP